MNTCQGFTKEGKFCTRKIKSGFCCEQHKVSKIKFNSENLLKSYFYDVINETTNMIELMKKIKYIKGFVVGNNPEVDFNKCISLNDYFIIKKQLEHLIENRRRLSLTMDYIFVHPLRDLERKFSYYGVVPLTEKEREEFYTFEVAGLKISEIPKRG